VSQFLLIAAAVFLGSFVNSMLGTVILAAVNARRRRKLKDATDKFWTHILPDHPRNKADERAN
jgi:hypothetical protein